MILFIMSSSFWRHQVQVQASQMRTLIYLTTGRLGGLGYTLSIEHGPRLENKLAHELVFSQSSNVILWSIFPSLVLDLAMLDILQSSYLFCSFKIKKNIFSPRFGVVVCQAASVIYKIALIFSPIYSEKCGVQKIYQKLQSDRTENTHLYSSLKKKLNNE